MSAEDVKRFAFDPVYTVDFVKDEFPYEQSAPCNWGRVAECIRSEYEGYRRKYQYFPSNPEYMTPAANGNGVEYENYFEPVLAKMRGGMFSICRYGALVLNTTDLFIADVDAGIGDPGDAWYHRIIDERQLIEKIEALMAGTTWVYGDPLRVHGHFRLYKTYAGYRVIGIGTGLDVCDPRESRWYDVARFLVTDPLYVKLCFKQECFRARLTPKPWRCGGDWSSLAHSTCHLFWECGHVDRLDEHSSAYALLHVHDAISGAYSGIQLG
jgi:hypothetical protein